MFKRQVTGASRGLELRLINYFLLIAVAAMMIGVEFYVEMRRTDLHQAICETQAVATVDQPLIQLRNKIVIMFGVLTVVVAIVLLMFIKNITIPLQTMVNVAERINQGDLSQVIAIQEADEIGQIGTAINELTSNLQEVAAYTAITSEEALEKLNTVLVALDQKQPLDREQLEAIQSDLEALKTFADSFTLLQTEIAKTTESEPS